MNHPDWLETAVIYNIYPQSFHDSNGDGIGDLEGIRLKLDYIQSLGVNVLWLNPVYPSPFRDAGYDISDYCAIAPRYGTLKDMDRLISDTHKRGLRLLLDFVPGHTSDQHPWFRSSAEVEKNRHSDWYIWSEGGFGPTEPNMVLGASDRDGHYLPNFFHFQPALNYGYAKPDPKKPWQKSPRHAGAIALREEMKKVMTFWLDRGVDGFRVDMASCLIKGETNNAENKKLWREMRAWQERHYPGRILVSEWSWPARAIDSGFHIDFMIHFNNPAYNSLFRLEPGRNIFPSDENSYFDRRGKGDVRHFLKHHTPNHKALQGKGFISVPSGNHDLPRLNCRRSAEELKTIFTFLLTWPGVPAIYYGDEIGMQNRTGLPSKEGGYIRTQARTPMQWNSKQNAGFSSGPSQKLYLPVEAKTEGRSVAEQEDDPHSLLHHIRRLLKLRQSHPALQASGNLSILTKSAGYPFAYIRRSGGECFLIVINPKGSQGSDTVVLPPGFSIEEKIIAQACSVRMSALKVVELKCGAFGSGIWRLKKTMRRPTRTET